MSQIPSTQCPPAYRVRVLTTLAELDAVADAWRALWSRSIGTRTPYLSFEWVRTWAMHFDADGRLRTLVVEHGTEVVGVMPLVLARHRIWPFTLEALETVGGESRNLIALARLESRPAVVQALATSLLGELSTRRRVLRLSLVPAGAPFLQELSQALARLDSRLQVQSRVSNFAPYVVLPVVWTHFVQSLGKRRLKVLARAQRRLDLERHEVSTRRCHGDEVEAAMRRLFELHDARWGDAGVRGLFHNRRNRAFHLDIARQCDRLGMLDLSEMTIDGAVASVHFSCVLDGVAYLMRSGRDTSFAKYDVGHLHDLRLFRSWIAERRHEADFLRGAEPYKFYWTSQYRVYRELLATVAGRRGGVSVRLARIWIRMAGFFSHRHPPAEVLAYLRMRRVTRRELAKMGVKLDA